MNWFSKNFLKKSIIALIFLCSMTLSFDSQSAALSKLKNRIIYDKPPIEVSFVGGVLIVNAPERKVIGWQSYCGFALSTCDESKAMIVFEAVDKVYK